MLGRRIWAACVQGPHNPGSCTLHSASPWSVHTQCCCRQCQEAGAVLTREPQLSCFLGTELLSPLCCAHTQCPILPPLIFFQPSSPAPGRDQSQLGYGSCCGLVECGLGVSCCRCAGEALFSGLAGSSAGAPIPGPR